MKEKIIDLFELAGYEYLHDAFNGTKLEFYDAEQEQTIVFWIKDYPLDLKNAMELIRQRFYDYGKSVGRNEIQSEIKKALGL